MEEKKTRKIKRGREVWKMEGQERPRRRERCDTCGGARKKIVVNKRSGKRYQKIFSL